MFMPAFSKRSNPAEGMAAAPTAAYSALQCTLIETTVVIAKASWML
jgi:hypothetical protein